MSSRFSFVTDLGSYPKITVSQAATRDVRRRKVLAINGNRVAALGQETTAGGTVPFAELSADGGASWQLVPFRSPGPGLAITALTAAPVGFIAAGQFRSPAGPNAMTWTPRSGAAWTPAGINGLSGAGTQITALAPAGSTVTGIGAIITEQGQQPVVLTLPAR